MLERQSILIADDEANLCKILGAEFSKAGYSVTLVHDGAQAVEQITRSSYHAVLLDIRMPVMDGLTALHEIRKRDRDIPVIMMTAYEGHDTMASALSMGATACVNKPFDLESIVALIKATLDEGRGQKSVSWTSSIRTVMFNRSQPILLEVHDGECAGQYESRIEDKSDQSLTIVCPMKRGMYMIPRAGTPVSVGFAGEDAFYSFETSVLASRETNPPCILVGKPAVIYRIQRRKHPRMLARVPLDLELVIKNNGDTELGPTYRVETENIGAGGAKILTSEELPEGAEVNVRSVEVPGVGTVVGKGRITRARKAHCNGTCEWEYGVQFTVLSEDTRHALQDLVETGVVVTN